MLLKHFGEIENYKTFRKAPVEYAVVQSPVKLCVNSNCGNSIPESTSRGMIGSHSKTRSSVVCDTEILMENIIVCPCSITMASWQDTLR